MGKKSRAKKLRQQEISNPTRAPLDPKIMESFIRGRNAGLETGKIEGLAEMMTLFDKWVDEIDSVVKGIGPKTKAELQIYFANRIREAIEAKKIHNGEIEILHDGTTK